MLVSIALTAIGAAAIFRLVQSCLTARRRGPARSMPSKVDFEGARESHCEHQPQSNRSRVAYGHEPGALVLGWPAKGGLYSHTASAVEIEFLGYGRFQSVLLPPLTEPGAAAEEELHCYKMRQLGAVWWKSERAWLIDQISVQTAGTTKSFVRTGWPAGGGVWVLSTTEDVARQKSLGMLFNAYSMEERCKLIEQMGGTFYADAKDCPDLDLAEP